MRYQRLSWHVYALCISAVAARSGKWFIELRYANTVLALSKEQNAIEIGTKDKLVPTMQTIIDAVKAGGLDAAMKAALAARKKPHPR